MTAGLMAFLTAFDQKIHWHLITALYFIFLETLLIAAIALFFSTILVTPAVVALSVLGVFIAGRSFGNVEAFFRPGAGRVGNILLDVFGIVLPRLDRLALSDRIVYRVPLPGETFLIAPFYTLAYCALIVLLATLIFQKREF